MALKNIIITSSIGSVATQSYGQKTYIASTDDQSFPLEHITGSNAGVWPSFLPPNPTVPINGNYTVDLVVNYDLPRNANDYIHRVGRTARKGYIGSAITICDEEDR